MAAENLEASSVGPPQGAAAGWTAPEGVSEEGMYTAEIRCALLPGKFGVRRSVIESHFIRA